MTPRRRPDRAAPGRWLSLLWRRLDALIGAARAPLTRETGERRSASVGGDEDDLAALRKEFPDAPDHWLALYARTTRARPRRPTARRAPLGRAPDDPFAAAQAPLASALRQPLSETARAPEWPPTPEAAAAPPVMKQVAPPAGPPASAFAKLSGAIRNGRCLRPSRTAAAQARPSQTSAAQVFDQAPPPAHPVADPHFPDGGAGAVPQRPPPAAIPARASPGAPGFIAAGAPCSPPATAFPALPSETRDPAGYPDNFRQAQGSFAPAAPLALTGGAPSASAGAACFSDEGAAPWPALPSERRGAPRPVPAPAPQSLEPKGDAWNAWRF